MNGYHDDPEATAACTTDDGFLTCGDVVIRDDDGYVHIVDRKKDLIISGGVNVYPREVEDVLATHAARRRVRRRRRPQRDLGRGGVGVRRPPRRRAPSPESPSSRRTAATALAGYKVPRHWTVTAALPRNAGGKVLKRELRDQTPPIPSTEGAVVRPHVELIQEDDYVWHAAELPGGEGRASERRLSVDEEDGSVVAPHRLPHRLGPRPGHPPRQHRVLRRRGRDRLRRPEDRQGRLRLRAEGRADRLHQGRRGHQDPALPRVRRRRVRPGRLAGRRARAGPTPARTSSSSTPRR